MTRAFGAGDGRPRPSHQGLPQNFPRGSFGTGLRPALLYLNSAQRKLLRPLLDPPFVARLRRRLGRRKEAATSSEKKPQKPTDGRTPRRYSGRGHEHQGATLSTNERLHPRIYVASLSNYNAGRLHGCWIDAAQDSAEIQAEVDAMLAQSPELIAEEWAIHDYDEFAGIRLGEWESFERVSELASALVACGEPFGGWYSSGDYDENRSLAEQFEESYQGEFESLSDYAYELATELGDVTEAQLTTWPFSCIDWEHAGRELEIGGDVWVVNAPKARVWVFAPN